MGMGRGGERRQGSNARTGRDGSPPILEAIGRLMQLVGGLDAPGVRARLAVALALTLLGKVLVVWAPLMLADGVNAIAAGGQAALGAFITGMALWGLVRFAGAALPQARDAIVQPVSEEAQRRAGVNVFAHVHTLSVSFHQSKRTGELNRTIERGVRAIDFLTRFLFFNIGPTIVELALAAGVLAWRYGPTFSGIAVGTVVLYAIVTFAMTEWRLAHRREMNDKDSEASGRAVDSLLNFETVKAFAAADRETARFDASLTAYARAAVRSNSSLVALNVAQGLIQNLGVTVIAIAAGVAIAGAQMGPGDVAAVVLVMMNLYAPLNVLGFAYREIKQASIDMEKMFALLDEEPDPADAPGAPAFVKGAGEIRFEGVSFTHEGRQAGLREVSFTVAPGERVAIVGASGAGKSTILKLLFRFYDPSAGRILVDGQDIRAVRQESLRAAIGLVPQDVVLFNDTLAYNIAYGRPDASEAEVLKAAADAQLSALIAAAPAGLATKVGERGLKLSGGEKQRVGIARVLLADPRILVLDEATSSLDSVTEAELQKELDDAATGRTTLVVAHRLATVVGADRILVLQDGRIVEQGRHDALVASGGVYADLWSRQASSGITSHAGVSAAMGAN